MGHGRYTLRVTGRMEVRLAAHVATVQAKARAAGVPEPSEGAVILALVERGLDAYAALFGEAEGAEELRAAEGGERGAAKA